ncbi:MAG: hypothetical protein KAR47_20940 [Planctomycetes bacterium]|nr:hypothetical protein [Planctomycetota bacterium]
MTQDMLEILIGKFLDAEITPAEQRMLDDALEDDQQGQELFNQLKDLHNMNRQAVTTNILEKGKSSEDIFEDAWQERSKNPFARIARHTGTFKVAAAITIGFLIGIFAQVNYGPNIRRMPGQFNAQTASLAGQSSQNQQMQQTIPMQVLRIVPIETNSQAIDTALLIQINTQLKQMQEKLDKLESKKE